MTYRIEVYGYGTHTEPLYSTEDALGWRMNDPEGWLQIVEAGEVMFLSLAEVRIVVVPNLGEVVQDADQ